MTDAASCSRPVVPQSDDALLMGFVLQLRPFAATPRTRAAVWDAIASLARNSGVPNVTNRIDVTRRVSELSLALLEQPSQLPRELRTTVCAFHERNCFSGYGLRLAGAFLTTLRKHATANPDPNDALAASAHHESTVASATRSDDSGAAALYHRRAAEDELLLRLVLTHRRLSDSTSVDDAQTWTAVTTAYNAQIRSDNVRGFVTSAASVHDRLHTATTALLDATSPYHAYLSPRVRAMLIELNMLTSSTRVEMRYRSPKAMATVVQTSTVADELLLRLVLLKRPFDADGETQAAVWRDIAAAYVAASGDDARYDGVSAMTRVVALTNTMLHHPQVLTPLLHAMLAENLERCRRRVMADTVPNETVQVPHSPVVEEAKSATPAVPSPTQPSSPPTETARVRLDPVERDELFMRLVLEKRPCEATPGRRTTIWKEITSDVEVLTGVRTNLTHRVSFLTKRALASPTALSPTLRKMLFEYNELICNTNTKYKIDSESLAKLRKHAGLGEEKETAAEDKGVAETHSGECGSQSERSGQAPAGTNAALPVDLTEDSGAESEDLLALGGDEFVTLERRYQEDAVAVRARDEPFCGNDAATKENEAALSTATLVDPNVVATATGSESMELDGADENSRPTSSNIADDRSDNVVDTDTANDALFMRIVLEHRPFEVIAQARTAVWDGIAHACTAAGGMNISCRVDATRRIGMLTVMLFERPSRLTPGLRAKVLEFHELNCHAGYAERLSGLFLDTLRRQAADSACVEGRPSESTAQRSCVRPGEDDPYQRKVEEDELLMALVMKHRPFESRLEGKTPAWRKVVNEFNEKARVAAFVRGMLGSELSAAQRVRAATTIFLNDKHPYRKYLTFTLRAMLIEFAILNIDESVERRNSKRRIAAVLPTNATAAMATESRVYVIGDDTTLARSSPIRSPEGSSDMILEENAQTTIERRPRPQDHHSNKQTPTTLPSDPFDTDKNELLMRIVLEKRPFDAKRGAKATVWDDIAVTFVAAGGTNMKCGGSVSSRIGFLSNEVRKRPHLLTPALRALILKYQKLYRQRERRSSTSRTTSKALRTTIREPVTPPTSCTRPASPTVTELPVATASVPAAGSEGSSIPDDSTDTTAVGPMDVSEDDDEHITVVIRPRQRDEDPKERQSEVVASSGIATRKRKASSTDSRLPTRRKNGHDVHAKRRRVDGDCADSQDVDPKDPVRPTVTLPVSPAVSAATDDAKKPAHDETMKLLETLEHDRQAYSEQHAALIEKLEGERQAHANETCALLAAIDRGRQERRDEFVAMATLMAQSLHPAPATTQRLHEVHPEPTPWV